MHDPMVLLWSVKGLPLSVRSVRRLANHGTWPTVFDVWHVEPNGRDSGTTCPYRDQWKHPHHWSVRFIPWRDLKNRFVRCAGCGRRMNRAARFSYMSTDKVWHSECQSLGHFNSYKLLMNEALHRIFETYGIGEDELKAAVKRLDGRDSFGLWYHTWGAVDRYRKLPLEERWKAPNEHMLSKDVA